MIKVIKRALSKLLPKSLKNWILRVSEIGIARHKGFISSNRLHLDSPKDKVVVIGNGPSLKRDKLVFEELTNTYDFICVNNFCDDPLYEVIKPKVYVFLDPYFFDDTAHPDWIERREKTFHLINEKTTWPLQIVIPIFGNDKPLKEIINNPLVKITKLATKGIKCPSYSGRVQRLYDSGFYGPPPINVLIYAIFAAIKLRYKVVKVCGADLSFHKDVDVDQSTNDLIMTFRHFNEPDKVEVLTKNPEKKVKWKMSELLSLSAETFLAHELLNNYAKSKGIQIINASSFSLIDSYERGTLVEEQG